MTLRRYHDFVILTDDPEIGPDGKLAAFTVRVFQSPAGEGERKERVPIPDYDSLNAQRRRLADRRLDLHEQIAYGRQLAELLLPPYARRSSAAACPNWVMERACGSGSACCAGWPTFPGSICTCKRRVRSR